MIVRFGMDEFIIFFHKLYIDIYYLCEHIPKIA